MKANRLDSTVSILDVISHAKEELLNPVLDALGMFYLMRAKAIEAGEEIPDGDGDTMTISLPMNTEDYVSHFDIVWAARTLENCASASFGDCVHKSEVLDAVQHPLMERLESAETVLMLSSQAASRSEEKLKSVTLELNSLKQRLAQAEAAESELASMAKQLSAALREIKRHEGNGSKPRAPNGGKVRHRASIHTRYEISSKEGA